MITTFLTVWFGFILTGILVMYIIRKRHTPGGTWAWLLLIVALPYFGAFLYMLFGGRKLKNIIKSKSTIRLHENQAPVRKEIHSIERMLNGHGLPAATTGNDMQLCLDGKAAYDALIKLIDNATTRIHIATYVLNNDEVGKDIIKRLAIKAKSGV